MSRAALVALAGLALACAGALAEEPTRAPAPPLTPCEEPRPEMCTQEYLPVCAEVDTGVRCVKAPCPSTEPRTYSNACSACSDPAVIGFRPGACPAPEPGSP